MPLAAVTEGGRGDREEGRNAETEIPFLSHPPSVLPHCQHRGPGAADGGSTAPLQRDGGGGNCSFVFTKPRCSPGSAAVRWDLSRGVLVICDSTVCSSSFEPNKQQVILLYSYTPPAPLTLGVLIQLAAVVFGPNKIQHALQPQCTLYPRPQART